MYPYCKAYISRCLALVFFALSTLLAQGQIPSHYGDSLQKVLDSYYHPDSMPGISAAVMVHGRGMWRGTVGESHPGTAMDTSMILGIGSNTKLFTATLLLRFQEQGLLSIDDSLYHHLPAHPNIDSTITIRQLLQHQSGLDDYVKDATFFNHFFNTPNKVWTHSELLSFVGNPSFTAGTSVEYCNTNFLLAGMILETVSGLSYLQLVRDSILTPLNLQHTYLEGFEPVVGTMAHPWHMGTDYASTPRISVGTYSSAAGCIVARPSAMVKWYDALFNQGFISSSALNELTSFINYPGAPFDLGLGLMKFQYGPKSYWGHGGQTIGYLSYFFYDPVCKHSVAIILNKTEYPIQDLAADLSEKICSLTGVISEPEISLKTPGVKLYPNPTHRDFQLESKGDNSSIKAVYIYNPAGVQVFKNQSVNNVNLSVNTLDWPQGQYIVQVETEESFYTLKMNVLH